MSSPFTNQERPVPSRAAQLSPPSEPYRRPAISASGKSRAEPEVAPAAALSHLSAANRPSLSGPVPPESARDTPAAHTRRPSRPMTREARELLDSLRRAQTVGGGPAQHIVTSGPSKPTSTEQKLSFGSAAPASTGPLTFSSIPAGAAPFSFGPAQGGPLSLGSQTGTAPLLAFSAPAPSSGTRGITVGPQATDTPAFSFGAPAATARPLPLPPTPSPGPEGEGGSGQDPGPPPHPQRSESRPSAL